MIRALVWKELRETAGIAAVFLAVGLAYIAGLAGWSLFAWFTPRQGVSANWPFHDFESRYGFIAAAFAMALAYRQSAFEPARGTALYLFHRPMGRRAIVFTKLGTGLGLQTALLSLPIVIYGWWAATPGHIAAPFEWSMTEPAFRIVLAMPAVYLGAFSSGIYEARWIGGRLLPLLATAPVLILLVIPGFWIFGPPAAVLLCAWFISDILLEVRTRDF